MSETIEARIENRIDRAATKALAISDSVGGISFANMSEVLEFAKLMAISGVAVPKHLRGNPGACLAIVIQALEWRLSPYSVSAKSYSVNDRLAFESQLIQAVILQRAPIKGRFKVHYSGDGDARVCHVSAELKDGELVDYTSPPFGAILPKNSPLWKNDPDQQFYYYSARALCRRHFPDVLLGIYARDELEDSPHIGPDRARDVTPAKTIAEKLDALTKAQDAVPDPAEDWSAPVPEFFTEELPPMPPAPDVDPMERVRERARIDAEKRIRRMAPTALSEEEKTVYLQAFDAFKAEQ
jgi:hypothetical protein